MGNGGGMGKWWRGGEWWRGGAMVEGGATSKKMVASLKKKRTLQHLYSFDSCNIFNVGKLQTRFTSFFKSVARYLMALDTSHIYACVSA